MKLNSQITVENQELKKILEGQQLARYMMYIDIMSFIHETTKRPGLRPSIIEFGGSNRVIKMMFQDCDYEVADNYPKVDILDLKSFESERYDFVVLDQILEHVSDPSKGIREVRRILKKGGRLIVTTPFLVKIHHVPKDYWRFTAEGMKRLLIDFADVTVKSWGNKDVVLNHIKTGAWPTVKESVGLHCFNLENDDDLPHVLWAFAVK